MIRSNLRGGFVLSLCLGTTLLAQQPETPNTTSPVDRAWVDFVKQNGDAWRSHWNAATGTPWAVFGPGLRLQDQPVDSLADARLLAVNAQNRFADLLGRGNSTFVENIAGKANRCYVFVYDQLYKGVPVIDGRADIRIHDNGVLSMMGSRAVQIPADFNTTPRVPAQVAWIKAHEFVSQSELLQNKPKPAAGDAVPVIWANLQDKALAKPTLAWQIQVDDGQHDSRPFVGKVYVDATTLAFLEFREEVHTCSIGCVHVTKARTPGVTGNLNAAKARRDLIRDLRQPRHQPVTKPGAKPGAGGMMTLQGTVTAWTNTNYNSSRTLANVPMRNMQVRVAGDAGTYYTDANGRFSIPTTSTTAVSVTVAFAGRHVGSVVNQLGASATITQQVTPGQNATFQFFNSNSPDTDYSQSTTYWATDDVMVWMRGILVPNPTNLDTLSRVRCNVNINRTCNATYGGNTTNYYRAGGSCNNTAIPTVIYHEWGHGIDDRFGGISQTDGLSEGWGDIMALYCSGNAVIGAGFRTNGGGIRTGNNTRTYPPGGRWTIPGPHAHGECWMGFAWDFRNNLITSQGATRGPATANSTLLPSIIANARNQPDAVLQVFLVDDNDGNLNNGTPHYTELSAAAVKRRLPFPERKLIAISHTPITNTKQQLTPQAVRATAQVFTGTMNRFEVVYRVDNGAVQRRAMVPTSGNQFVALLPGQLDSKSVSYHLEAQSSLNSTVRFPETGEISYIVRDEEVHFFDNLDGSNRGWTHRTLATGGQNTQDDWQWGTPAGKSGTSQGVAWRDPSAAFSGSRVWANDLGQRIGNQNWNGAYQGNVHNQLRAPTLNLSGKSNVMLSFMRWLSVEGSQFDQATILVNNQTVWGNPTQNLTDTGWVRQEIRLSPADNQTSVQLDWRLRTDGGLHLGGWAIDDVKVFSIKKLPALPVQMTVQPEHAPINGSTTGRVSGTANAPIVVGYSLSSATTNIPGLPSLELGGTIQILTFANLDNAGNWSLQVNVPNQLSLVGTLLYLQSIEATANNTVLTASNLSAVLISR